jgi:TonB family protein
MFDTLLESRPSSLGLPRWGIAVAIGVHAAAIAAALRPAAPPAADPPIRWIEYVERPTDPSPTGRTGGDGALVVPRTPTVVFTVPPLEPVPGVPTITVTLPGGAAPSDSLPGRVSGFPGDPLPVSLVQEPPELLAAPLPAYPSLLREARVEGLVVVQVVVDTLGQVEPGSARIVQHAAPGFEAPAVAAILAARFRPARVWGRAVRVLVRIPVAFRLGP